MFREILARSAHSDYKECMIHAHPAASLNLVIDGESVLDAQSNAVDRTCLSTLWRETADIVYQSGIRFANIPICGD
jgi:hypothetical protein